MVLGRGRRASAGRSRGACGGSERAEHVVERLHAAVDDDARRRRRARPAIAVDRDAGVDLAAELANARSRERVDRGVS